MPTYYCDDYERITGRKPGPQPEADPLAAVEDALHKAEAEISTLKGVENKAVWPTAADTK